jgi:hypothetical protein
MDAKERRAAESKVFAHYYKCLTKNLNDVGGSIFIKPYHLHIFS